ncbi:unnamed protein product [Thlaspi arvense]|uniref:CASP-like protein n=1 Tax=Thlaspi arvense TaxID=13288 RepID=A0AAU9S9L1_THLAR|nr:unnamed protein product [Thlaspi arvense]
MDIEKEGSRREEEEPIVHKPKLDKGKGKAHVSFVVVNSIVGGYLTLSLPFSIVCILRPLAVPPRLFLILCDTAMMGLTMMAASASATIVYLAHNGNSSSNWLPVCQQFGDFCQGTSGAVVASFIAAALLMILVILSAFALKRST